MTPTEPDRPDTSVQRDPVATGEAALDRAREISRRIAERVKKLTEGDTASHASLLDTPTEEQPPIS